MYGPRTRYTASVSTTQPRRACFLSSAHIPYRAAAENIALVGGLSSLDSLVRYSNEAMMESPEHRANILNPAYKRIGIGFALSASM
jgi:uncharacterized protein YkwD